MTFCTQSNALKKFNRLYREIDKLYHRIAVKIGISDSTLIILYVLAETGNGCRQKDISQQFCLSKQTINSSVKSLSQKGMVTLFPDKGRDMKILLTAHGEDFVREHIEPFIQRENETFYALGAEDAQELLRITEKYIGLFKEKTKDII